MKRFYSNSFFNAASYLNASIRIVITVTTCLFLTSSITGQNLYFVNGALESGTAGANGAVYRFPNGGPGIDILVEIRNRSGNDVVLENIDVSEYGKNLAFQPQLKKTGTVIGLNDWWMEFEIRFVKTGTNLDANLTKLTITAMDVDGDGLTVGEYVEFYKAKACTLASLTQLTALPLNGNDLSAIGDKNYRFKSCLAHYLNIDTVETAIMAYTKYENMNKIKVRVGGESLGLGSASDVSRYYSLYASSYQTQAMLPVKLTDFTAALINKKVSLSWTTAQEINVSHFSIQRSTNGVEFTDAGIIFTEGNSEVSRSYSFKDAISTNSKGLLYYRLKIVDLDGKYEYSTIKLVKLGESDGKLELQAFPNPVVNELRITIPESWQNKQVVYELYTTDGQLLRKFLNKSATQTEIINMQFYQPGSYIVKAMNDKEIASQRIIKRR